jgi:phage replication O-like protein O
MANPQPDKFTKISNELLDQVPKFKLNGSQFRIILVVWRYTYGFNRKDAELAVSFLEEATGIARRQIIRELTKLIEMNVIQVVSDQFGTKSRTIKFNKDYDSWKVIEVTNKTSQIELFSGDELVTSEVTKKTPLGASSGDGLVTQERKYLKKGFKDNIEMFETFYNIYPRKASKSYAKKTWDKHCKDKNFNPELVIQNTSNFAETCKLLNTGVKYIPHASTYLNQKKYEDYTVVDPEGLATNGDRDKLSDNMDFLKNQLGGAGGDGERSKLTDGSGMRSLSE